jgi:hypothetical protein
VDRRGTSVEPFSDARLVTERSGFQMGRGFALLVALVVGPSALTACGEVSFEPGDGGPSGITGGNETDAAQTLAAQIPPMAGGGAGSGFQYSPLTSGNTWTALYTDYFGAPQTLADGGLAGGRASCSAVTSSCHASSSEPGAVVSNGYVCPGTDKDACYTGITSSMVMPVLLTPGTPFESCGLASQLRCVDNLTGPMPLQPPPGYPAAYTFSEADLARLSDWVDAGFPNN